MARYRIGLVRVRDYKHLVECEVTPDDDASLILIAGPNEAGKSSLTEAIDAALRGKKAMVPVPVRIGAEESRIHVELKGGKVATVDRVIQPDGKTQIEVQNADGASFKAPQDLLDAIVGARFIDPLKFLQVPAAEQRSTLLSLIDTDGKIAAIEDRRQKIFDKRTDTGRDLKKAQGELARLPAEVALAESINVAELAAARARWTDLQHDGAKLAVEHDTSAREKQTALDAKAANERNIAEFERQLAELRARREPLAAQAEIATAAEDVAKRALYASVERWKGSEPERLKIDADLARADAHNRAVFAAEAANKRRADAAAAVAALESQREQQTALLDKLEAQKDSALKAAKLPADGLGFDAEGLTLVGIDGMPVPFAQAGSAPRFMVALAIAMASSPNLADIWIRDAAVLDETKLELVRKMAAESGHRAWVEIIRPTADSIIIHDGRRVDDKEAS
jgi:chromosome segregation ATPase